MGKKILYDERRRIVIASGLILLIISIIVLIIFEVMDRKNKDKFLKEALDVYDVAFEKYEKLPNDKKIKFSSVGINSLELKDKSINYCVNYNEHGIKLIDVTNGKYSVTIENKADVTNKNVKRIRNGDFKCTNPLPVLALSGYDGEKNIRRNVFNGNIEESKVEKVIFVDTNKVPQSVINSYDASLNKDNSVMAWYVDKDKNDKYELYIGGEGGVATSEDASYLFAGLYNISSLDLSNLDTSNAKSMKGMFYYLVELSELNVSNLNTFNVKDMSLMFYYLIKLNNIDLKNFDTTNVINMEKMFTGNWSLLNLDLSNFNTSNVNNMSSMFMECSKLEKLNIKSFDFSKANNLENMFKNNYLLSNIEFGNINIKNSSIVNNMFCKSQYSEDNESLKGISNKQKELMFKCE